jgi:hypothetical protein
LADSLGGQGFVTPRRSRDLCADERTCHCSAGILHRVFMRLSRTSTRRSLPKLWDRGVVLGRARERKRLIPCE